MSMNTREGGAGWDVIVVGGGTSGATFAGIAAQDRQRRVLLLEAGPDFGAHAEGNWPPELLDARAFGLSHDWDYASNAHASHTQPTTWPRARVFGGCSAHNGCVAVMGHRRDYDAWAEAGLTGWGWDDVVAAYERATAAMQVSVPEEAVLQPFHRAYLAAAQAAGWPKVETLLDPDLTTGVAPAPFNIVDGVRWNAAFAYLDPVRGQDNLTLRGNVLVDRVVLDDGRAVALEVIVDGQRERIDANGAEIVLCAGAYNTPAILLRSGIGDPAQLEPLGIAVQHALPGVGARLTDHPITRLDLLPSAELLAEMEAFGAASWMPDEQVVLMAPSAHATEAFDLHMPGFTHRDPATGDWFMHLSIALFPTRSHGSLRLASADPTVAPIIDHGYLSDADAQDINALADGVEIQLRIAQELQAAGVIDGLLEPHLETADRDALLRHVERTVGTCYHPSCSCRMGLADDPLAVVDTRGYVHGLSGLRISDPSIFPAIPRANTNLPAVMVSERLARNEVG